MSDDSYDSQEDSSEPLQLSDEEAQQADAVIAKALSAIESGQQVDAVLGGMIANLPAHLQAYIKRKVAEEAEKIQVRRHQEVDEHKQKMQRTKEQGQGSALKLFSMALAAKIIGPQALEKISSLLRTRPDLQQAVKQAGESLNRNGVQPDVQAMSEEELGTIAPSVAHGRQQDRERGV